MPAIRSLRRNGLSKLILGASVVLGQPQMSFGAASAPSTTRGNVDITLTPANDGSGLGTFEADGPLWYNYRGAYLSTHATDGNGAVWDCYIFDTDDGEWEAYACYHGTRLEVLLKRLSDGASTPEIDGTIDPTTMKGEVDGYSFEISES